jgi:hypothetical protein
MTSPAIGAKLTEYYSQLLPHLSIYLLKGNKAQQAKAGHVTTTKSGFTVSPSAGGGDGGPHGSDFIDGCVGFSWPAGAVWSPPKEDEVDCVWQAVDHCAGNTGDFGDFRWTHRV